MSTSDYPSGSALFCSSAFEADTDLRVTLAVPFDVTDVSDSAVLETDLLVPSYMFSVAEYGAAWRLIIAREVRRTFTEGQGEPRNATEVQPGAVLNIARGLKSARDEAMNDARRRLDHLWGVKGP